MLQRFFWGLVLIDAGVLFLLEQLGVITVDLKTLLSTYWPVFIIMAGFSGLLSSWRHGWGAGIWNLIVCGVGVVFLLHNLGITGLSIGELFAYLGPAALILFGLALMFRPSPRNRHEQTRRHPDRSYYEIYGERPPAPDGGKWEEWKDKASAQVADKIDEVASKVGEHADKAAYKAEKAAERWERKRARREWRAHQWHHNHHYDYGDDYISTFGPGSGPVQHKSGFIGDVFLGKDYWDLQPMTISHFIGDTLIDLTKATIPLGETKLVVSTFIGDVKMLVPADVEVEIAVTASSFIGDMHVLDRHEAGMFRNIRTETPHYRESDRKIRLIVSAFVGDVLVQKVG
ncbi:cell wall-active antibiotics response protein LiaF [Gordoniibacillus kamchatkensis]|uniref:cell wall-active antibiotics response protein LiaF n=1 Tax=Gordoniibacillus kamchatkensis TaxID=1590651 RepID=UPI000696510D|nr:cell wall-active antibiotics response protein LiaF [Paenibacillus sp. VKM B-2647]